ncbi:DUF6087 family protein [Streptomyces cellostaticus]|uniref:DUF6087 family protein n=1 Tax=Streptomyces cellostaticus TaxID=67285 RepID=UPI000A8CBD83|nr:hypothetical protein Scel_45990 [Streptomyces cellostaticus]
MRPGVWGTHYSNRDAVVRLVVNDVWAALLEWDGHAWVTVGVAANADQARAFLGHFQAPAPDCDAGSPPAPPGLSPGPGRHRKPWLCDRRPASFSAAGRAGRHVDTDVLAAHHEQAVVRAYGSASDEALH